VVVNARLEGLVEERTAALAQRDLLLQEVYHRVKNNLQIIDSFIVMQARQLSDSQAKKALLGLRDRVYALGLVHHQLMGSGNLKTFDIAPFLQELAGNIVAGGTRRDIKLSVRAIPLDVGLDFAIPLGLVVTELVTNSLKHAFPDGKGNIDVVLDRSDDGAVALVVSDDGKGYTSADAESGGHKAALGTSIIKGLVAQLEATMVVQHTSGTRSEIRVAWPALT
jgi:two-component sensor histidine kinase